MKVVIEELDLAENDYLTIIDGNQSIAHLTGSILSNRKFRSNTNTMIVTFVTDNSLVSKGFQLKYTRLLAGKSTLGKLYTLIDQSYSFYIYSSTCQGTIRLSTSPCYQDQPINRELRHCSVSKGLCCVCVYLIHPHTTGTQYQHTGHSRKVG